MTNFAMRSSNTGPAVLYIKFYWSFLKSSTANYPHFHTYTIKNRWILLQHYRVNQDYCWLGDFLFCSCLNHFPFAPCSSFGLIHSLGHWQCPQLVMADSVTDFFFSIKPVFKHSYFSTGPFRSLVFSIFSCSFFFCLFLITHSQPQNSPHASLDVLTFLQGLIVCSFMIL